MKRNTRVPTLLALGLGALSLGGCDGSSAGQDGQGAVKAIPVSTYHNSVDTQPPTLNLKDWKYIAPGIGVKNTAANVPLNDHAVDYGLALRTAALKLKGELPTLAEIESLQNAVSGGGDPNAVYTTIVTNYVNAPTFARQMMTFWRNQLRMGGTTPITGFFQETTGTKQANPETAPAFLAKLTVEGADMRRAFTESSNACPTFNAGTNSFTAGACFQGLRAAVGAMAMPGNGIPEGNQAGVLTNPGFMAQYYSNMGFRRARLIQEIFACSRMPAEFAPTPKQVGPYIYSSPWAVDSVPSNAKAPDVNALSTSRSATTAYRTPLPAGAAATVKQEFVDFQTQCQNCHSTMNHRAAMFAVFDAAGFSSASQWAQDAKFMVVTPVSFSPFTTLREYIFPGDTPAWRFGKAATTFQAFGQAMAEDPEVHRCMVARVWNNAYSRDDIVESLALVPPQVTEDLVKYFADNNFNLKKTILKLYTDGNFIRF